MITMADIFGGQPPQVDPETGDIILTFEQRRQLMLLEQAEAKEEKTNDDHA